MNVAFDEAWMDRRTVRVQHFVRGELRGDDAFWPNRGDITARDRYGAYWIDVPGRVHRKNMRVTDEKVTAL
jgi:hypothetical protein